MNYGVICVNRQTKPAQKIRHDYDDESIANSIICNQLNGRIDYNKSTMHKHKNHKYLLSCDVEL